MKLFLITFFIILLSFAGIAIKLLLKKNAKFSGTCASQSPFLNKENKISGVCGKLPSEKYCKQPEVLNN